MSIRLTIGKKLLIGVAAIMASLAVLSLISWRVIAALGGSLDAAVNSTGKKLDLIGQTREAFQNLQNVSRRTQIAYAIVELERHSTASGQETCSGCHTPASLEESAQQIEAAGAVVKERSKELRTLVSDATGRQALDTFDQGASRWIEYTGQYLQLAHGNRFDDAHAILMDKIFPIVAEAEKAAKILAKREGDALNASNQQARASISSGRWTVFIVIGFNLLVGASVLWVVLRITATLRHVAAEMSRGAEQVARKAAEVSTSSQSLAQGASDQASSLAETSSTGERISAMTHRNTESSGRTAELVSNCQERFQEAHGALSELEKVVADIDSSSGRISRIIKTIDEIAFQTNILALNAAVEAARAGDAGLGFAVVADEVRSLAQRCAQAAKDTASLIQESIGNSQQGKVKVGRVAEVIRAIMEQSGIIKKLVDEVNLGSQEQTRGVEQVANAITRMERITQQNAAGAEQNAAAGHALRGESESLKGLIQRLIVMVDG
ncbi:MAG TPA: methyl-accepting chemotaxis protein [Bryobacteraceae bacterium]|nr:methyl-accepting chemotaxis protein [Bryobacteraceae bacterium]